MTRVSTAIINWNNRQHVVQCLVSLLAQQNVELDVVVLDNGSVDGSAELIEQEFPHVRLIRNGRNLGFAAAHNIGFRETTGDWHLVLNSDVVLEPDYVIKLLEVGEHDSRTAALSGKLLRFENAGERNIIDSAGIEMYASRRVWDRGAGEPDEGQYDSERRVFGCCAAAGLYRRTSLLEIAPDGEIFPEIYFAYYEDVDLAWRLNRHEWSSLYVPSAVGRHVRGGSTKGSTTTRRLVFRNRYVLLARNDSLRDMLADTEPIFLFECVQLLRLFRYPRLIACIPEILSRVRAALRQRRELSKSGERFELHSFRALISPGSGIVTWMRRASQRRRDLGEI